MDLEYGLGDSVLIMKLVDIVGRRDMKLLPCESRRSQGRIRFFQICAAQEDVHVQHGPQGDIVVDSLGEASSLENDRWNVGGFQGFQGRSQPLNAPNIRGRAAQILIPQFCQDLGRNGFGREMRGDFVKEERPQAVPASLGCDRFPIRTLPFRAIGDSDRGVRPKVC